MSAFRVFSLMAGVLALGVVSSLAEDTGASNSSKPVIFLKSPATPTNASDNGNSESRVSQKIITEIPLAVHGNGDKKQVISSQGYQLEVLEDDDNTSEEGQERSDRASPSSRVLGQPSSLGEPFIHDYDDNSAKEDIKDDYAPKGNRGFGEIKPTADINKARDIFVEKEMSSKTHSSSASDTYSPSPTPHESKYNLEYQNSPVKFENSPILLKQSSLPLEASSLIPVPHPLGHHGHHDHHDHHDSHEHHDLSGHTAGYGHGFHHHQQKIKSKPLKPSVVYRDPHDKFDHRDKIRTLDKDHLGHEKGSHHDHYEPHVVKGHEFNAYRHGKKVYQPDYHYDQSKIPECAHKNKYIYNITFCLDDPHYPTETIVWALKETGHHSNKLLSDVTYQSADNLVTGLTRAEEEGYTYKHYFGATHAQNVHLDKYKPPYNQYTYEKNYFKKGGYICPSDIYYARPKRAMNTFGKWKVIINLDHIHHEHGHEKYGHHHVDSHSYGHDSHGKNHDHGGHGHHDDHGLSYDHDSYGHSVKKREYKDYKKSYTQTLRLEQCIYPNAPCSYIDSHYNSKCIQKHNFVRLVAWTHDEGIHVDTFKMPIACSCHVRQPIHFYHESGHRGHEHGHIVPSVDTYHGHDHHGEHDGHIKKLY